MFPPQNSNITIFFRSGLQISGTVIHWSDDKSAIRSLTGNKITIIEKTHEDVLFCTFHETDIKEDFVEVAEKSIKTNNDIQTLAELKSELNDLERQQIAEKLRSHEISGNANVGYGSSLSMLFGGIKK
jgi:hypothetical protein